MIGRANVTSTNLKRPHDQIGMGSEQSHRSLNKETLQEVASREIASK